MILAAQKHSLEKTFSAGIIIRKCHASMSDFRVSVIEGCVFRVKHQLSVVASCLRFILNKKKTEAKKKTQTKTHNLSMACDRRLIKDKLPTKKKRRKKSNKQVIV